MRNASSKGVYFCCTRLGSVKLQMKFRSRLTVCSILSLLGVFTYCKFGEFIQHENITGVRQKIQASLAGVYRRQLSSVNSVCNHPPAAHAKSDFNTAAMLLESKSDIAVDGWDEEQWTNSAELRARHKVNEASSDASVVNSSSLHVVVIPHSHNDPGWLQTLQDYWTKTRQILDNMLQKLLHYKDMRFIWSETVFLSMWWDTLSRAQREAVTMLLRLGRLEIVTGGWVMPDEASPHYAQIIDQMIEGHEWLRNHLGYNVTNNWSNDPFGYSVTMAFLLKMAGYENMAIVRIHQDLKEQLGRKQAMNFEWRQEWARKDETDIICYVDPYGYIIKENCGPNWDICKLFDFHPLNPSALKREHIQEYIPRLVEQFWLKARNYKHNVIPIFLGDDFRYDTLEEWDMQYNNWKFIMKTINSNPTFGVSIKFGTLNDYFRSVSADITKRGDSNSVLTGDFFPYSDNKRDYWTGYFTTRPYLKQAIRTLSRHLRAAEILHTLTYGYAKMNATQCIHDDNISKLLASARRDAGLLQHHDAITGTSTFDAAFDYEQRLYKALRNARRVMEQGANCLLKTSDLEVIEFGSQLTPFLKQQDTDSAYEQAWKFHMPEYKGIEITRSGNVLYVFNSLAHARREVIHILISSPEVNVLSVKGNVQCQISVLTTGGDLSNKTFELLFVADLEPMGISKYSIIPKSLSKQTCESATVEMSQNGRQNRHPNFKYKPLKLSENIILRNGIITAGLSPTTGVLLSLSTKTGSENLNMEFLRYPKTASGAYIFKPYQDTVPLRGHNVTVVVQRGVLLSQVYSYWGENLEFKVLVYHTKTAKQHCVEIQNLLLKTFAPFEIAMKFRTTIRNNRTLYTDSNGLQMVERRSYRHLSAAGNYYPITNQAYIEDSRSRLTLLAAQPHGAASLQDGELEVALEHKTVVNDDRGMSENVDEPHIVPSRFILLLESRLQDVSLNSSISHPTVLSQMVSRNFEHHPFILKSLVDGGNFTIAKDNFSPLLQPFPCDVHVVNLRVLIGADDLPNGKVLMLVHKNRIWCNAFEEHGSSRCVNKDGQLVPKKLFNDIEVKDIQEWTLTLKHKLKDLCRNDAIVMKPNYIHSFKLMF